VASMKNRSSHQGCTCNCKFGLVSAVLSVTAGGKEGTSLRSEVENSHANCRRYLQMQNGPSGLPVRCPWTLDQRRVTPDFVWRDVSVDSLPGYTSCLEELPLTLLVGTFTLILRCLRWVLSHSLPGGCGGYFHTPCQEDGQVFEVVGAVLEIACQNDSPA
jgi:hypothetical protein